jgi:hypothetical protein
MCMCTDGAGKSKRSGPREKGPVENLTPGISASQEFVLGGFTLGAGDDDVVRSVGFAVGAEGA